MAPPVKPDFALYVPWLKDRVGVTIDEHAERQYNVNVASATNGCRDHGFFKSLDGTLETIAEEYYAQTGTRLFSMPPSQRVILVTKSFESALNKSYRYNIVQNDGYPDPPKGGWLVPERWFEIFDDIVRCQVVCRYLDGPGLVAKKLAEVAEASKLWWKYESVQHDRGYYAYHFYLKVDVDLFNGRTPVTVEIQLTTQLQEIVYDLTHGFYEELRLKERADQKGESWKWEYTSARFKSGYLSHTLHLLEGLIAEVRGERLAPPAREERNEPAEKPEAADPAGALPPLDTKAGASG